MKDDSISRRGILKGVGAGVAVAAASGRGAAEHDEYNVGIKSGRRGAGIAAAKREADEIRKTIDLGSQGSVAVGKFSAQARQALENNPHIDYVEPNYTARKLAETLPWGIDRVDADVLHSNGDTGSGAEIAVLDTGVDDDHPDLADNVLVSKGAAFGSSCGSESGGCRFGAEGYNGNDCNYEWSDDDDHGTHVSGTANAVKGNNEGVAGGVSTQAGIIPVKVLSGCGSGSYADIADGIRYATDNGADVISMSLGGSSGDSTLQSACQYAVDNNVVIVAAAGNDGPCTDCVGYPAAYSTVIAVSATDSDDSLADYSSTGPEVEIAAPGTSILSTIPPESDDGSTYADGYERFSGTSMATPHVSGAAAQVKAEAGITDNAQIRDQLTSTAEDVGLGSNESGSGLLDAEAAVGGSGGSDDTTAPTAPSNLTSTGKTDSSVSLSWDASSDDGTGVDHYNVYVDGSKTTESTDTSETVTGLASNTTYDFSVTAVDGAGNESSASNTISVTTEQSTSSAPAIDQFSIQNQSNGGWARFEVAWSVSDADGDLASVDLTMDQNGTVDSASYNVAGGSASGSTRLQDKKGSGSYDITLTVTDEANNTTSQTKTVSA